MERGDWWATVHGVHKESSMTEVASHKHSYNDHKIGACGPCLWNIGLNCLCESSSPVRLIHM